MKTRRRYRLLLGLVVGIGLLAMATPAYAAPAVRTQTIPLPGSRAAADRFGFAAAISGNGNTAIVGAPGANPSNGDAGQAYMYTKHHGSWTLQQQLVPSPSASNDFFGGAVALSEDGDVAIVGATSTNSNIPGAAFVFTHDGNQWTQQAMLTGSDTAGDQFGFSVALNDNGDQAVVGAPGDSSGAGAAYVFVEQGNIYVRTKLTDPGNPTPAAGDSFGFAVAISASGRRALIGADQSGLSSGPNGNGFAEVYVAGRGTWQASQLLRANNGQLGDAFGDAVALKGNPHMAFIGAEGADSFAGAAYSFVQQGTSWSQSQELLGTNPGDNFGYNVTLNANSSAAAVSAPQASDGAGTVYVFAGRPGDWSQRLQQSGSSTSASFGIGLALGGDELLVGADGDGTYPNSPGAAYAYRPVP